MFGFDDVLTGGLSLLGGAANNFFAGERQEDAQAFNAQQAALQREWQERMAKTKYQMAADDMQKAGLNRILAVGSPASAGGGASATSSPGAPVHDMLGPAVNTAMAHARLKEELNNMKETNANIQQDTDKKRAETRAAIISGSKMDDEAAKVRDERAIVIENLMTAKTKALRDKIEYDQLNNPVYKVLRQTGNVGEETQRASSALGNIPALINAGSNRRNIKLREDTFKERFGVP
uniref:Minor capsid protein n=1 Tax=Gokushovirinae environmental samples TaxID=1478972 RepID=A0A2R3UAH3_9VIRU|nr:minor capsid protein [Gokushovirinae environmental samples]